jgi:putative solute:sodium symporter small subunit
MTLWLIAIWAVAIFGFQVLLKVLGKPTPEPAHIEFQQVWAKIQDSDAENHELKTFANSVLQVLAKVYVKPQHKEALENAFSWSVFKLADENAGELLNTVQNFEHLKNGDSSIHDNKYLWAKNSLETYVSALLDLAPNDNRRIVIPFSLKSSAIQEFDTVNQHVVEEAMDIYLIHNRSVLTDTKFLGFPFHYFYTAVFLLCLFIFLCLLYCLRTDKIEKKLLYPKTDQN